MATRLQFNSGQASDFDSGHYHTLFDFTDYGLVDSERSRVSNLLGQQIFDNYWEYRRPLSVHLYRRKPTSSVPEWNKLSDTVYCRFTEGNSVFEVVCYKRTHILLNLTGISIYKAVALVPALRTLGFDFHEILAVRKGIKEYLVGPTYVELCIAQSETRPYAKRVSFKHGTIYVLSDGVFVFHLRFPEDIIT